MCFVAAVYDSLEFLILYLLAAAALCVALVYFLVVKLVFPNVDKILNKASTQLSKLKEINGEFTFHNVPNNFHCVKRYDNKGNYMKIEPAYVMASELRQNLDYYLSIVKAIEENRAKYPAYTQKVNVITGSIQDQDCSGYKYPTWLLAMREKMLFRASVKKPPIDCTYRVEMHYSSPKGQVNLSKQKEFALNDIKVCLDSVARSRLDRVTYSRIAAVERGEVSDSLRYDIMNRDGFKCAICGASAAQGAHLHVDHIVPIAKGGKTSRDNLRTLCERCNIGKSDKIENQPKTEAETKSEMPNSICPRCGNQLVLRKGKYGDFYGCSSYPKCRYTRNLTE